MAAPPDGLPVDIDMRIGKRKLLATLIYNKKYQHKIPLLHPANFSSN
jgi:hypothetical protein